jgi:hypothetical protein
MRSIGVQSSYITNCQVCADTNCVIVCQRVRRSPIKVSRLRLREDCPSAITREGIRSVLRTLRAHVESSSTTKTATQTTDTVSADVTPSVVRVLRVRLVRKLAEFLNGVDLSGVRVGDSFDLPVRDAC